VLESAIAQNRNSIVSSVRCWLSGDERNFGHLSGGDAPKATCKRTVAHGQLTGSIFEKT